jgi:signal transduction histidine kinase
MIRFLARSISRKLAAAMLGVFLVTYLATAAVVYSGVRSAMLQSNAATLGQLADIKFQRLANGMKGRATNLTAWSELDVMNDMVSGDVDKRIARALEELQRLYGFAGNVLAFDASGKLIASAAPTVGIEAMPPQWRSESRQLVFLGKQRNLAGSGDVVVIEAPVFASFAHDVRTGTLVLIVPWQMVEDRVRGPDTSAVLVETGGTPRVLMADPPGIVGEIGLDRLLASDVGGDQSGAYLIGRSASEPGLLAHWQLFTLQRAGVLTASIRRVAEKLVLLGILLAVPIVGLVRWLSWRLTTPVVDLTRVAREIADTDALSTRVQIAGSDELTTLAEAFNRMTETLERGARERDRLLADLGSLNQTLESKVAERTAELEAAIAAQRRLIGDISHEIKSPLARLTVALGLVERATGGGARQFERMHGEIANISALAGELLILARLDGGEKTIAYAPFDLTGLVEGVVEDALFEMGKRTSDVTLGRPAEPVVIEGNADLLRRAIENVVRNALFYTAEGVPVEITLAVHDAATVTVSVRDHGRGVPEANLPHLFEPFYRVDTARARQTGGAGIGLAICQRVIETHGGHVRAQNCKPPGLLVEMTLPVRRGVGAS